MLDDLFQTKVTFLNVAESMLGMAAIIGGVYLVAMLLWVFR